MRTVGDVLRHIMRLFGRNLSVRFVLIGCINTLFSYSIFIFLLFLGSSVALGSLLALTLGVLFSYCTQGTVVFRYKSKVAFVRFIMAWVAIYVMNLAIIHSLMELGVSSYLAAAAATVGTTLTSFFIQKLVVFRVPPVSVAGRAAP